MNRLTGGPTAVRFALPAAALLAGDGTAHLFWSTGLHWPAASRTSLTRALLNVPGVMPPAALIVLAVTLFAMAALLSTQVGLVTPLRRRLPERLPRLACQALAVGAALRGLAGLVWITGLGSRPGSAFYWLNLGLYTPACLLLLLAGLTAARQGRRADA